MDAPGLVLEVLGPALTWRLDAAVVTSCLRALVRLSGGDKKAVRVRLGETKALTLFMDTLKNLPAPQPSGPVEAGLALLIHLAGEEGAKARMGTAGACELVTSALRGFLTVRTVQDLGLKAINKLAISTPDNKKRFGTAQGCEALTAALTAFPKDRDIQYNALEAIERSVHA
jgi:hypothetical protein